QSVPPRKGRDWTETQSRRIHAPIGAAIPVTNVSPPGPSRSPARQEAVGSVAQSKSAQALTVGAYPRNTCGRDAKHLQPTRIKQALHPPETSADPTNAAKSRDFPSLTNADTVKAFRPAPPPIAAVRVAPT